MHSTHVADSGDLTARALIRERALELFAEHGLEAVSMRRIAAAAGVSPALVAHHFHSLAGLRKAVETWVVRLVDGMFSAMAAEEPERIHGVPAISRMIVAELPADSPVPAYLRRLLLTGEPAGHWLFARWYAVMRHAVDRLAESGALDPAGADPPVRAAFLAINDLATLVFRKEIATVLAMDPLSDVGRERWAGTIHEVHGVGNGD